MKQRVYSINGKTLVKGNANEINDNEILVSEGNNSVTLTNRVNGTEVDLASNSTNIVLMYPILNGVNSVVKILPLNKATAKIENFFKIIKIDAYNVGLYATSAPTTRDVDNTKTLSDLFVANDSNIKCNLGDTTTQFKTVISYDEFFKPNVEECDIQKYFYTQNNIRNITYPLDDNTHIAPTMLWYTNASNVFSKDENGYITITNQTYVYNVLPNSNLYYIFYTKASANNITFDGGLKGVPNKVIACPLFDMAFRLSTIEDVPTLTAHAKVNMQNFRKFFKLPHTYKDKYKIGDTVTLEIQ